MAKHMLLEQGIKIPLVTTLHGSDITLVGSHPFYKPAVTYSINNSDLILNLNSLNYLCIEDIKKSSSGRIIVISSFVNKSIGLNNKIYPITAAAKGALEALTQTLSFQLARDNVTVNAISPGYTKKDGKHSALSQDQWD